MKISITQAWQSIKNRFVFSCSAPTRNRVAAGGVNAVECATNSNIQTAFKRGMFALRFDFIICGLSRVTGGCQSV